MVVSRSLGFVVGTALLVGSGCGERVAEEKGTGEGEGAQSAALLCKGAGWGLARPVAVGFEGRSLVLLGGDGARETVHTFVLPEGHHGERGGNAALDE
jgi:hypothetical protein